MNPLIAPLFILGLIVYCCQFACATLVAYHAARRIMRMHVKRY